MGEFADYVRKRFADYVKAGDKSEEGPDVWLQKMSDEEIRDLRGQYQTNYLVRKEYERRGLHLKKK